ncbi:uncharacterized protein KY384_002305 [Bacidia gigantensis]|uniref:uncharacterized protein n=1 Tax=Bacidia gigantensis TaxID=2732470 RepID=UPI001D0565BE|nr:uncharacterized protein KY384_002305 [Bacidia gigantensis]KAG8533519.1 hypothetical protein KY384_002305 [Bacidia gigantensis]
MPAQQSYMETHPEFVKPKLPYIAGASINIRAHKPTYPPPRSSVSIEDEIKEWESSSPLARCLKHPPTKGTEGNDNYDLHIESALHARDGSRAQVVRAKVKRHSGDNSVHSVSAPPEDESIVAKFYDPLYADHDEVGSYIFNLAESTYATEATAYAKVSKVQGQFVPKFYGSFTCSFPASEGKTRQVRLILMEFVEGEVMYKLDPNALSVRQKQDIMKGVIDAETAVFKEDVMMNDVAPRNILILPESHDKKEGAGPASRTCRVVLIDFDNAYLARQSPRMIAEYGEQRYFPGQYISPLLRWAEYTGLSEFDDWIDWDWKEWIGELYAADKSHVTDGMKEVWRRGVA